MRKTALDDFNVTLFNAVALFSLKAECNLALVKKVVSY